MGRSNIQGEWFRQIYGETRLVKEENRRSKSGINYVYSLVNTEPSKISGEITRSKGLKFVYDTGFDSPMQNIKFAKDNDGILKFTGICNRKVIDIINWDNETPASHSEKGSVTNLGYVDIISCSDKNLGNILTLLDGDYPKKYDFSTVSQLHNHHKSSFGLFDNGRLWTNKMDEVAVIWFSAPDEVTNYDVNSYAGYFTFGSNFNAVTAMSKIFVPAQDATHLVIAKKNEIHAISGSSGNPEDSDRFIPYELNIGGAGTLSPRCLVQVDQEVFILGENDIKQYSSIISDSGVIKPQDIAAPIRELYQKTVKPDLIKDGFFLHNQFDGRDGRIYSFVPTLNANKNNYAFCFDRVGGWFRRDFQSFNFTCFAIDPVSNKVYLGTSNGKIYEFNPDNCYSYEGEGYNSFVDYGFVDFNSPNATKTTTSNSYIEIEVSGKTNIDLVAIKRNSNGYIKPTKLNLSFSSLQGIYDESRYDETMRDTNIAQKKNLDIKGSFEGLGIQLSLFDPNINFIIKGMYLEAQNARSN